MSRMGFELSLGKVISEIPTISAKTIMLNISPDIKDASGLLGIIPRMLCGISCMDISDFSIGSMSC